MRKIVELRIAAGDTRWIGRKKELVVLQSKLQISDKEMIDSCQRVLELRMDYVEELRRMLATIDEGGA